MKRLVAWLAGLAGGILAYRKFRRKPEPAPPVAPAEELRAKLAEARAAAPPAEPEQAAAEPDVDERRRAVHEQGRQAIDEMRQSPD